MTWEEYKKKPDYSSIMKMLLSNSHRELTNIECPKCGKQVYVRYDIIMFSYPSQRKYECDCGWFGYC